MKVVIICVSCNNRFDADTDKPTKRNLFEDTSSEGQAVSLVFTCPKCKASNRYLHQPPKK